MSLEFTLQGLEELTRMLKDYPERIQRDVVNAAVRAGATLVRKRARNNLIANGSVKSGNLLKSLRYQKVKRTNGVFRIFAAAPHAHLIEWGTGPRKLKKPQVVELSPGAWATVTRTGSVPAKPFFRPAIDENRREILLTIGRRMAKRMDAEAQKMAGRYGTMSKSLRRKLAK